MRGQPKRILSTTLVLATVLAPAACGSGAPATPKIVVKSPAFATNQLPAQYTCDGQNISPPLEWGAVPAGVKELALFVVGFTPEPGTKSYKVSVEWAVGGLNSALHRLAAGQLPPGAFLGRASGGKRQRYSICPAKGTSVHYQFELYGVPPSLTVSPNFSGDLALARLTSATRPTRADAQGGFVAIYRRP